VCKEGGKNSVCTCNSSGSSVAVPRRSQWQVRRLPNPPPQFVWRCRHAREGRAQALAHIAHCLRFPSLRPCVCRPLSDCAKLPEPWLFLEGKRGHLPGVRQK
jgi:hypothetical protein